MDFENVLVSFVVFLLLWLVCAAIYTRLSPRSQLVKQTVGL